ncbi:hypothetical protein P691DRAFT_755526 [Macrolepiota fuliginosa MF-IS2]|uniref:BZIP domain-containing protein n=1 Tax=Macrolepiota fuliginosa MF-IS2 TaxID=1400762 RepID=A0A9P5XMA6_9AGAR|nr:hypothetical protein P691DRAFT_755526 [Macrolepiota fuliginosa MF-IS2]
MSSKRGRKRNDNLPPNRARDVQRAFRARRAAHLQALEQRVTELEEENNCLRHALNLPPSTRPPLGKGPTGKDRPKDYEHTVASSSASQPLSFAPPSRGSSAAESPGSRTSSHSPHTISVSMSSRPMQLIESGSQWSNDLLMGDSHPSDVAGPTNSPYQLTPMTAPLPLKPIYPSYTSSSLPSSSRNSVSSEIYIPHNSVYSHSSDRPLSHSYGGQGFTWRNPEIREEPSRHYSYTPSPFTTYDHASMHSQSPSPGVSTMQSQGHQPPQHQHHRESPISYAAPQRRCVTDPQGFSIGQGFSNLSNPSQVQTHQTLTAPHCARQTELIRQDDDIGHLTPPPRSHPYGPDGRLNHQPLP